MPRTRPPYPEEFKREAIELVRISSKSQRQIAEDLGISDVTLRNWVKQSERDEGKRWPWGCRNGRVTHAGEPRNYDHRRTVKMLARVTAWEGGTAEGIRAASAEMRSNISQGPPPGVKSTGLTMLANPEGRRVIMIGLFANEDDLQESEAALKEMNPPEGLGNRGSIDVYEVVADVRM